MEENKTTAPEEEIEEKNSDEEEEAENTVEENDAEECSEQDEKLSRCEKKKVKKLEGELEKALGELSDANDKYMRLYAEYDNYRKRSQKEKEAAWTDAYCDAVSEILPVLDNLERAAQFSDGDAESPMAKGLELTLKSFAETLEKMGVHEIDALGKPFDPELHNAVMHVEDESLGENIVAEVFMKGYAKGDKVIRHSMVKVAN